MKAGPSNEVSTVDLLAGVPLLASLAPAEIEEVAAACVERSHRKGSTLWRVGDPADSFVVVATGELEVWGGGEHPKVVARLGPGEVLGEVALLLGEARTATVTVARPSRLLEIDAATFSHLASSRIGVLEHVSRVVSKRLASRMSDETTGRRTNAVGVLAAPGQPGKSMVAACLAALFGRAGGGDALLVRIDHPADAGPRTAALSDLAREGGDALWAHVVKDGTAPLLPVRLGDDGTDDLTDALDRLVSALGPRYSAMVFDLPKSPVVTAAAVAEVCDVLVELVERPGSATPAPHTAHTRVLEVLNLYSNGSEAVPINACEPFVLPPDLALVGLDPSAAAGYVLAHPRSPVTPPLERLARKVLGTTVGLALGGGAAFGMSHIGVVRVLEEHGVPVDLLVGSSMGSIVALGSAAGMSGAEMQELAERVGTKRNVLSAVSDLTLSRPGLLRGDRLVALLAPLLGPVQRFEDLQRPCQTVAADIETGERVCIGEGMLADAFRASSAVPLLWSPVRRDGRVLVDGSVVDPVPADVVREAGADICIAVNVVPQLKKGVDTVLTRATKRLNTLNPMAWSSGARDMPNVFDVVMSSLQTLEYELGNFKAASADIRLNIDLADFTWIEFYRPTELIERGAQAAERALPQIRRVLADHAAAGAR